MRTAWANVLGLSAILAGTACNLAGCDDASWKGRYDGRFEGSYEALGAFLGGRADAMRSEFSGTAYVEVETVGDGELRILVTDCLTTWRRDGDRATLVSAPDEGCRLDVAGETGVVGVRPDEGEATLDGDGLHLRWSGTGPPRPGASDRATVRFTFDGER